jgi:hypothetical protein
MGQKNPSKRQIGVVQSAIFVPAGYAFIGVGGGVSHAIGRAYSIKYGLGAVGAIVSPIIYGK